MQNTLRLNFTAALLLAICIALACPTLGSTEARPASRDLHRLVNKAWKEALRFPETTKSCRDTVGYNAALALAKYCRYMSSATHPPCGTSATCQVMIDHLTTMYSGVNPGDFPEGLTRDTTAQGWREVNRMPVR